MRTRTIRLRLTLLYGVMFLLTGAVLLTIGYALVRHNLGAHPDIRGELKKLGLPVTQSTNLFGRPFQGEAWYARDFQSTALDRAQLLEQTRAIHRYGASFPRMFRPPYGDWNATTRAKSGPAHSSMLPGASRV